jgi:hypothetical protein
MAKKGHWESDGMEWDEGETPPICEYCNAPASKITLYETDISGVLCCLKPSCLKRYAKQNWGTVRFVQ